MNPPTPDDLAVEIGRHVSEMAELCGEEIGVRISRKLMMV